MRDIVTIFMCSVGHGMLVVYHNFRTYLVWPLHIALFIRYDVLYVVAFRVLWIASWKAGASGTRLVEKLELPLDLNTRHTGPEKDRQLKKAVFSTQLPDWHYEWIGRAETRSWDLKKRHPSKRISKILFCNRSRSMKASRENCSVEDCVRPFREILVGDDRRTRNVVAGCIDPLLHVLCAVRVYLFWSMSPTKCIVSVSISK